MPLAVPASVTEKQNTKDMSILINRRLNYVIIPTVNQVILPSHATPFKWHPS